LSVDIERCRNFEIRFLTPKFSVVRLCFFCLSILRDRCVSGTQADISVYIITWIRPQIESRPILQQPPSTAPELLERIKTSLSAYTDNAPQSDDITLLAVQGFPKNIKL
jgi:hypothetical protein